MTSTPPFELGRAITENQLVLHFQPIVDVPGRRLRGVEALVRWKHPERGIVSPMEFIPEAEATGLIRQLTLWVLREALLHANVWRRDNAPLTVGVNLSIENLRDAQFQRFLDHTLQVAGGAELLHAEVAARVLVNDPPVGALELMRSKRIRVAVDDIGENDATVIETVPANVVKIGRGLISRLGRDHRVQAHVRAIAQAARDRGMELGAVGVEDQATWDMLGGLGFVSAQGYFIAAPMPPAQLAEWRATRK